MESTNFMKFSVNRPGTRVTSSSTPELTLVPTFNKLSLNPAASKKLGWENGDYVSIVTNDGAESFDEMYFITKGIGEGNQSKLSALNNKPGVGRMLSFNYAGVYSRMLQGTPDALEASPDGLARDGLVQKRVTEGGKVAYTAMKKVFFKIGEPIEVEINDETVEVYPLTNARFEDFTPQSAEASEEE